MMPVMMSLAVRERSHKAKALDSDDQNHEHRGCLC